MPGSVQELIKAKINLISATVSLFILLHAAVLRIAGVPCIVAAPRHDHF
jgi:hypothetical protein